MIVRPFCILSLLLVSVTLSSQVVTTGVEQLRNRNFDILKGKRVGLITNPTGVDSRLKSTVDILHDSDQFELVALYGPEHGVRGDVHAGDKVESTQDPKTAIPVYSLYGKTRKPTKQMLKGVDVLVYDIQDIGCRSFTYISTLGLAMEAAAEQDIEFVVLDRPNPINGLKIEGCLTEDKFTSFVSQFKIPYLYGLTCGELANMLNQEGMIGTKRCRLTVVPMQGWRRDMTFKQTGLPWVLASPHIPQSESAQFYPVSGIVGELGYLSIGVGYTLPFQLFAAEWVDADALCGALNSLQLPGVAFRPIHFKPFYAALQGKNAQGVEVYILDYSAARLSDIQFYVAQEMARLWPDKALFDHADPKRFNMFDKVSGSDSIRNKFSINHKFEDIRGYWTKDEESFRKLSQPYYLYE